MNKKVKLTDIDGYVNGVSRRAIINELLSNRYVFDNPIKKKIEKVLVYLIIFLIPLLIGVGFSLYQYNKGWESGYKYAITDIYIKKGGKQ